jgi:hypothetical protein
LDKEFHVLFANKGEDNGDILPVSRITASVFVQSIPKDLTGLEPRALRYDALEDREKLISKLVSQDRAEELGTLSGEEVDDHGFEKPFFGRSVPFDTVWRSDHRPLRWGIGWPPFLRKDCSSLSRWGTIALLE